MEERAHNIATKLLTSLLPPKSRFPLLCWNFDAFGMYLWVQPITVSIFHAESRAPGRLHLFTYLTIQIFELSQTYFNTLVLLKLSLIPLNLGLPQLFLVANSPRESLL